MTRVVEITEQQIDVNNALQQIRSEECGGIILFLGTTRSNNNGRTVTRLNYISHVEMSIHQLNKIVDKAIEKYSIKHVVVIHRIGQLKPGEISVIVAVSTIHRKEAFEGARFIIDELKKHVPIWKEEFYDNGKCWLK